MEPRYWNEFLSAAILCAWIYIVKGNTCPQGTPNVARMCSNDHVSGNNVYLDTYDVPRDQLNCTCSLRTTAVSLSVNLMTAPDVWGCGTNIVFGVSASSAITFKCYRSGTVIKTSSQDQYTVQYVKDTASKGSNYCVVITAQKIEGVTILPTVSMDCIAPATTTASTTTSTTSTPSTTPTTTDITTSKRAPSRPTRETTKSVASTSTSTTVTSRSLHSGYSNSISKTAIITVGVIVGAGLLVMIVIVVAAIVGKRSSSKQHREHRFARPITSNLYEIENGATRKTHGGHDLPDKLHISKSPSKRKCKFSEDQRATYDNSGYAYDGQTCGDDTIVISEKL